VSGAHRATRGSYMHIEKERNRPELVKHGKVENLTKGSGPSNGTSRPLPPD